MQRQNILSQIEEDISKFKEILSTEKNKLVLEEKIIDILGEIEVKVSQIISDKNGRNILQKEEVFQRYLSLNQIESQYTSIDDFLDELILKLSQELTQRKIKLKFDLFERGNAQIDGNGNAKEKIEIKTSQKNKIFFRVLHKMGIDFADVKQFEETLNPERMRKVPYQIYHIMTNNLQKTVLISDQIGQATFVYDTIISPEIFQIIEKGEEIEGNKALKIIYNQKTYEKNLEIALNTKLTFEEKEVKIINEEEEKTDYKKEKITQEQLFQILWNYEGRSEQESYDHFMNLGQGEINKLEIGGNKVSSLLTFSLIQIKGSVQSPSIFQQWIEKVFEGKNIVRIEKKNYTLNSQNQVEIDGVIYTAITNTMKQEEYSDLPDNGANILKKMKELSDEEKKELTGAAKEARIWGQTVLIYDLKKIQEKFKVITLNDKNQVEINGVVYTAVTNTMKQEEYRDLPDNGANILKKMKELSEEEIKELTGAAKEAKIGCQTVLIYDLKKIQEKFKIYTLNDKNQVEINGVMYTAITGNMKQEDYRDLPDNGYNILKKMKELSEEEIKELTGAAKEARIGGQTVPLYDLKKIQEKFKVITLNDKNQVEIDGVIYTAITKRMKQEDYRDLPENGINILRKIKQLSEKEMKDLRGAGKEARIGPATAPLYNLKKIQEKFKIYTFNDKNQVEIDGVIYTAITNSMKQEEYRDLPDNGKNILRKMKDISEEEMKNLIGAGKEARIGPTTVPLYNLKKIQEMFGEE